MEGTFFLNLFHVDILNVCHIYFRSILNLFGWSETKSQPSEDDKVHILTTEYSLHVDPDKKIIEHAIQNEVDEDLENVDLVILV